MAERADAPAWLSLDPGERVVWTGKPRTRRIIGTVAGGVVVVLVAVVAGVALPGFLPAGDLPLGGVGVWLGVVLVVLLQAGQIALAYLRVENAGYVLTDRNVYKKTGVLSETVTRVGLDRVQNTRLQKGVRGNLFDYGSVAISTAGGGGTELVVTDLDDPETFRDELQALARTASEEATTRAAAGGPSGHAALDPDRLATLAEEFGRLRETADRLEATLETTGDTHDERE
jgi:uncharacterized membrane protein YdbT with pleckstrin-like domain